MLSAIGMSIGKSSICLVVAPDLKLTEGLEGKADFTKRHQKDNHKGGKKT